MATLAAISLAVLAISAIEQLIAVMIFMVYCRKKPTPLSGEEPAVMVVLPVRGADSTLARCVTGLLQQQYDNFRVRIIFDSHTDPGWKIVDSLLESHPDAPIELMQLGKPRATCSLKCSAVYEATEDLGDCEIVAFVDSDIVPHETWLRELIAPLADEKVGVANGNRWYLPPRADWGSMLRYCWNAVAVVTMFLWEMPWGGTLAIKRRVLEETDIRERWIRAGCEDVPLGAAVKQVGLKTRFVPQLLLKDREETSIQNCLPFLDRQLLWARLYHPACWWTSNVWQVVVAVAMLISIVCVFIGLVTAQATILAMSGFAVILHSGMGLILLRWMEKQLVPDEQGPALRQPAKSLLAINFTQVVMVRVIFVSLLTKMIHWRGIGYRINGPWDLEMVEYSPYTDDASFEPAADLAGATPPA